MYAIVFTGGKQYKVAEGDYINVEKLPAQLGEKVALRVVFLADGSEITTDAEALSKAQVVAEVTEQFRGKKQIVFKFKKRKGYKKTQGHRQSLTRLHITGIYPDGAPADALASADKADEAQPEGKADDKAVAEEKASEAIDKLEDSAAETVEEAKAAGEHAIDEKPDDEGEKNSEDAVDVQDEDEPAAQEAKEEE